MKRNKPAIGVPAATPIVSLSLPRPWPAFIVPVLFVFSPTLLLIGAPSDIALAVLTAGIGVWLVSAALAGYLVARLRAGTRVLLGLFGLMALVPAGAFAGAVYTDLVGVAGGFALILLIRRQRFSRQEART